MTVLSPRRLVIGATLLVGALTLAACGGGSSNSGVASLKGDNASSTKPAGSTASTQSMQDAFLAFAKCMRGHGVSMPDPTFDANGRPQFQRPSGTTGAGGGPRRDDPTFQAAETACRAKLQGAFSQFRPTPAQQAQTRKNLLKYAACMRSKGVNFPDPTFGADGRPQFGGGPAGTTGAGRDQFDALRNDPNFQSASQVCRQQIGGSTGGRGFFGGPGGGFGGPPPGDRSGVSQSGTAQNSVTQ